MMWPPPSLFIQNILALRWSPSPFRLSPRLIKGIQVAALARGAVMKFSRQFWLRWLAAVAAAAAVTVLVSGAQEVRKQTFAPHERNKSDAPPPIVWEPPALTDGTIDFESAEERHLRIIV